MALIEFKNLPDTSTPLSAENLNHNFNELVKKHIITAYCNTFTASATSQKINMASSNSIGELLTLENGSVKIGAGVSKVKISANISAQWNSPQSNDFVLMIYKNDTNIKRANGNKHSATLSTSVSCSEFLYDVSEGDLISLYLSATASNSIIYGEYQSTFLTVEVVA